MNNITLSKIAVRLTNAKKIALFSHTSPDGDTIGAVTGLALMLETMGKETVCLCDTDIPPYLQFVCKKTYQKECSQTFDLYISVDVASPQMLGSLANGYANLIDIRIDHHAFGTDFAKFNYCDPTASAACEIIARLAMQTDTLTADVATALYVGLSTDTGSFRYSSTTSETLRTAATLIDAGALAEDINEHLYENMSLDSLRTNAFFLENMEFYDNGKILLVSIPEEKRIAAGLSEDSLEGMSALARKITGVQLGISLRQKADGSFKASMRARKSVDCAALCALFGGGGHLRAAGATICADSFDHAKKALMDRVQSAIRYEMTTEEAQNG